MSIEKAELKAAVIHNYGVQADDRLEKAKLQHAIHNGAKQGLRGFAKNILALTALVDKDLEEEKLPEEPLLVAKYAKDLLAKASLLCENAARHQENCQISSQGEIAAYTSMVEMLDKDHASEIAKAENLSQLEDGDEDGDEDELSRPLGSHPGPSLAAKRKAEEAAEDKKAISAANGEDT